MEESWTKWNSPQTAQENEEAFEREMTVVLLACKGEVSSMEGKGPKHIPEYHSATGFQLDFKNISDWEVKPYSVSLPQLQKIPSPNSDSLSGDFHSAPFELRKPPELNQKEIVLPEIGPIRDFPIAEPPSISPVIVPSSSSFDSRVPKFKDLKQQAKILKHLAEQKTLATDPSKIIIKAEIPAVEVPMPRKLRKDGFQFHKKRFSLHPITPTSFVAPELSHGSAMPSLKDARLPKVSDIESPKVVPTKLELNHPAEFSYQSPKLPKIIKTEAVSTVQLPLFKMAPIEMQSTKDIHLKKGPELNFVPAVLPDLIAQIKPMDSPVMVICPAVVQPDLKSIPKFTPAQVTAPSAPVIPGIAAVSLTKAQNAPIMVAPPAVVQPDLKSIPKFAPAQVTAPSAPVIPGIAAVSLTKAQNAPIMVAPPAVVQPDLKSIPKFAPAQVTAPSAPVIPGIAAVSLTKAQNAPIMVAPPAVVQPDLKSIPKFAPAQVTVPSAPVIQNISLLIPAVPEEISRSSVSLRNQPVPTVSKLQLSEEFELSAFPMLSGPHPVVVTVKGPQKVEFGVFCPEPPLLVAPVSVPNTPTVEFSDTIVYSEYPIENLNQDFDRLRVICMNEAAALQR